MIRSRESGSVCEDIYLSSDPNNNYTRKLRAYIGEREREHEHIQRETVNE
jgi:hypothetical protein